MLEDFKEQLEDGKPQKKPRDLGERLEALGLNQFHFAEIISRRTRKSFDSIIIDVDKWVKGKAEPDSWVYRVLDLLEQERDIMTRIEDELAAQDSLREPEEVKKLA